VMVGAELFRQGPRPFAMSLVGLTNWVFTAVVALLFEIIQVTDSYLWKQFTNCCNFLVLYFISNSTVVYLFSSLVNARNS